MTKFLLLLGPSGTGKSTIIRELRQMDERFIYISPYITRPLRENETDKVHISDQEMDLRKENGEFLTINNLYGIRYATSHDSPFGRQGQHRLVGKVQRYG